MKRNVYAIIDGQAGSCGKGKVIGQFALKKKIDLAITNCMPNAGHTFEMNGKKRIFHNIPVSSINPNTTFLIGPGSAISMETLEHEYENNKDILENREIIVHPLVPLIEEKHRKYEREHIKSGSTFKGCRAVYAEKAMRLTDNFFKQYKNIKASNDYYKILFDYLKNAKMILLEGAQGSDLDINHSGHYPNTTSRQVSVAQMLADSGISPYYLKKVIMVLRTFPIRISNEIYDGTYIYSGNYGKSKELTWEQVSVGTYLEQYPTVIEENEIEEYKSFVKDLTETTTVTKKNRRIFDFDVNQARRSIEINKPDEIYLNFFQYLDESYEKVSGDYRKIDIDKYRREYINWLESELDTPITMLGTGSDFKDYIDRRPYLRSLRK